MWRDAPACKVGKSPPATDLHIGTGQGLQAHLRGAGRQDIEIRVFHVGVCVLACQGPVRPSQAASAERSPRYISDR